MESLRHAIHTKSILIFLTFVALSTFFFKHGYKEPVPDYMEFMKWCLTLFCVVAVLLGVHLRSKLRNLLLANSVIVLFFVFLLRFFFWENTRSIFGPSYDSYAYLNNSLQYADYSYMAFCERLQNMGYYFDDLGYFSVNYWFCQFSRDPFVVAGSVAILNVVLLFISSLYLYKLGLMVCNSECAARVSALVWQTFPFLTVTIACGLKEVCFCSIIIGAIYNIYRYKNTRTFLPFLWVVLFICLALLFRTAVAFMLLFMFLVNMVVTERNAKKILILGVLVGLAINILLPLFFGMIGASFEQIEATANARMGQKEASGGIGSMLPFVASALGPFPNLDRLDSYNFMSAYSHFLKCSCSVFFLLATWRAFKQMDVRYFALLFYVFTTILMLIVAGVSMDMRYHITYMPVFLLLTFDSLNIKRLKWIYPVYYMGVIFIIYMYASRSL